MLAKVNGFEITSSTEVLFLEKTISFPVPVMITTRVRGELFWLFAVLNGYMFNFLG